MRTLCFFSGFDRAYGFTDNIIPYLQKSLQCRDRIVFGVSDQGRPLQEGHDGSGIGAIKSDLGETVFRDLHLRARLLHLLSQGLHLSDGEAGIVSHDDHLGGCKDLLQRRDGLLLFRSIHKLSPVGEPLRTRRLRLPFSPGKNSRAERRLPVPALRAAEACVETKGSNRIKAMPGSQ